MLSKAVPRRLDLPLAYWNQRRLGGIEREILYARRWARPGGVAVDIGANSGLYTYELARWFDRVEALEPNVQVSQRIRDWGRTNVNLRSVGASSSAHRAILHVPVSERGVEYAGWGSLYPDSLESPASVRSASIELVSLDSLQLQNVAFIKIDVEGHEQDVLEGAQETIRRCRPVVLVEVKPQSRVFVLPYFRKLHHNLYFLQGSALELLPNGLSNDNWPRENVFAVPHPVDAAPVQ
jgi:FkbM family methyltransferase